MDREIKIIIVIALSLSFLWNVSVVVWTNTPDGVNNAELKLACLQGGGEVISGGVGNYLECKNPNSKN